MSSRRAFLSTFTYRLLLALVGLVALVAVLFMTAHTLDGHAQGEAAAWTRGGAVTLAVGGLFGLLRVLGQGQP